MNLTVITPPEEEPVSVETAKAHLRVDSNNDNALIASYIKVARELGEALARRAFVTQTLRLVINTWPHNLMLKLPRPPLQSVVSVTYLDPNADEHEWTDWVSDVRSEPGVLIFKSLPSAELLQSGAIAVEFIAGYDADVPSAFVQGILQSVAHFYEFREAVDIPTSAKHLFLSDRGSWF